MTKKPPDKPSPIPHRPFNVFISYSSKDDVLVRSISDALSHRGVECWVDKRRLKPGEDWTSTLGQAIEDSKMCLIVLSKDTEFKPKLSNEWAMIQAKAWDQADLTIVPILLDNVDPPIFMRRWNSLRCDRRSADLERVCTQVVKRLWETDPAVDPGEVPERDQKETAQRFKEISQALEALSKRRDTEEDSDE